MTATPYQPDYERDAQLAAELARYFANDLSMSVGGRYDDDRVIVFSSCVNHEIAVEIGTPETIGDADPLFVDALDLLRVVSHVALNLVYDQSPSELERHAQAPGEQAAS